MEGDESHSRAFARSVVIGETYRDTTTHTLQLRAAVRLPVASSIMQPVQDDMTSGDGRWR